MDSTTDPPVAATLSSIELDQKIVERIQMIKSALRDRPYVSLCSEITGQNRIISGVSVVALRCSETTNLRGPSYCLSAWKWMALFGSTSGRNGGNRPSNGSGQGLSRA